jgi:phosphoribosyl 1,2-cyclic phosphodiesterase
MVKVSVLASGSSGNSVFVSDKRTNILIDAGISGKEISKRLGQIGMDAGNIDAILLTHEHIDHIKGVGVLSRRYDIPIYANELTWKGATEELGKIKEKNCKIFDENFMLGHLGITPFSIPHDANDPVGFVINKGLINVGVATDMGYVPEEVKKMLKGMDLLIIEANHDLDMLMTGSYPIYLKDRIRGKLGHLSNDDTAAVLPELIGSNFPRILLSHLSKDNNIPELAYITVKNNLKDKGLKLETDLRLGFAFQSRATELFEF